MAMSARGTPLWPAGHLPRKGGDRMSYLLSPISSAEENAPALKLPISPLAGEMSGRTEGGALAHSYQAKAHL
ncbi:lytic murein transglycosylase [Mesorhizobium sp. B2-5-7]|nr:lytic murein transglycosylase [Mesorhizobium sp. B2-5-7]